MPPQPLPTRPQMVWPGHLVAIFLDTVQKELRLQLVNEYGATYAQIDEKYDEEMCYNVTHYLDVGIVQIMQMCMLAVVKRTIGIERAARDFPASKYPALYDPKYQPPEGWIPGFCLTKQDEDKFQQYLSALELFDVFAERRYRREQKARKRLRRAVAAGLLEGGDGDEQHSAESLGERGRVGDGDGDGGVVVKWES